MTSEAKFRALLEASPDAIVIVDEQGRIQLISAQAEQMFGYTRDELVGASIELLVPERARPLHGDHRHRYLKSARTRPMGANLALYARRRDGTEFPVEISLSPLRTEEGILTISAIRDVTERKGADDRFRALLESAPDAMVIVDQKGQIVLVNAQTERLFGYPRHELLGAPVELLVPTRFRKEHDTHRSKYWGSAHPRPMGVGLELHGVRKDGTEFPVEISLSPLTTSEGMLVASAIRDITERKAAEAERLRLLQDRAAHAEASRIKDEFLATLSHELRTPLNAILGWTTLIRDGAVKGDMMDKAIATIERNARAQAHLIEDLLDVSRIVSGNLRLHITALDLCAVIESAVEVVRPAADAKDVTIDVDIQTRPLLLTGDPDRLQQVAWNLLSNAVKFSRPGGRVLIRSWMSGRTAYLFVRDTGQGIAPKFLPHVFDRFRQADSSYTRLGGGLGLGLAIVRSVVEMHGGQVEATSSGEGQGATFIVTLPMAQHAHWSGHHERHAGASDRLDGIKVLVVDDRGDERELFAAILAARGADVRAAASAQAAIATLQEWQPNILVTDIAMPGEDGYALLRRVRDLPQPLSKVPAIAVTAHARSEDRALAFRAGFQEYVSKPIESTRLIQMVRDLASHGGDQA